jgi:hypothetical protein
LERVWGNKTQTAAKKGLEGRRLEGGEREGGRKICTSMKTPGIPKPLANRGTGNTPRSGEPFKVLVPFSELRGLRCWSIEGPDVEGHVPFSGVTVGSNKKFSESETPEDGGVYVATFASGRWRYLER